MNLNDNYMIDFVDVDACTTREDLITLMPHQNAFFPI